jgi:hypothetical protein
MSFKNTKEGMVVLDWWRERCLEWCYARNEEGKFGDQKYLDDWMTRFPGIRELQHLGGGVAPWNLQQYTFQQLGESIEITESTTGGRFPLVFFHFHALKIHKNYFDLGNYELTENAKRLIYGSYLEELDKVDADLKGRGLRFNWHALQIENNSLKSKLRVIKRKLLGTYNIIPTKRELSG